MATSRKHAGSFTGSPTTVPLRSSAPVTYALPDTPNLVRRRVMAALGLGLSGMVAGWPAGVHARAATPGSAAALTPPAGFESSFQLAETLVRSALEQTATSSISMALISGQGVLWAQALGTLGDAAKTPVTTDTLYCIGSCSKLLATVATLQLADQGLIHLDDPVVHHLPAFRMQSPHYEAVTVRMLLCHQSGFPGSDYSNAFTTLPYPGYSRQVFDTLAMARLKHFPGEMSVYCNDGFTLLEQVIQAVTGLAYYDFVQRNILDPLGMAGSRYAIQLFPQGSFAPGRDPASNPYLECINVHASGGLFTTPTEMARFAGLFLNRGQANGVQVISEQAIKAMAQLQAERESLRPVPVGWGFGLGWDDIRQGAFAVQGLRAWRKNGGTSVYGSDFYVLPDHNLAFMITGTSSDYKPDAIAEHVLSQALLEQRSIAALPQTITVLSNQAPSPYAVSVANFLGIYANYQAVFRITAAPEAGTVQVQKWQDGAWTDAKPWVQRPDGLFAGADAPLTGFGQARAASFRYLTLHTPSGAGYYLLDLAFAQALDPLPPAHPAWAARIGRTWVVVNERYTSLALTGAGPALRLFAVPELPGYIGVDAGPSDTENQLLAVRDADNAGMCLKIPFTMSRDLNDLSVENHQGHEYLRFGRSLFKPLDAVEQIVPGAHHQFTVPANGHATCFRVADPLHVELNGAQAAFVYEADLGPVFPVQFRTGVSGTLVSSPLSVTESAPVAARLQVPRGGLLMVYGEPGAACSVKAVL